MAYHTEDTIVAIASAPGGAYRGIVRVGGDDVVGCLTSIFTADSGEFLEDVRVATAIEGCIQTVGFTDLLPCRLYLWPNAKSFTRQPIAEIHTIGSPPLLAAVVETVCQQGARLAEPGEFTLRAFLAGRIDLTQAEAVLGVIDADGEQQLQSALTQLSGGLSGPLQEIRDGLLDLLAHLEAGLDFVEEDISFISEAELLGQLSTATEQVTELLERMSSRGVSEETVRVVLLGLPNAGKSSLFNALTGEDAAIVSPQQGTTRDYVTSKFDCDGVDCLLIDTAGAETLIEETSIAGHAQTMMGEQSRDAQLRLLCIDATDVVATDEQQRVGELAMSADIIAYTKCDQANTSFSWNGTESIPTVKTSSQTGTGLAELRTEIARLIQSRHEETGNVIATTATRCRDSLQQTIANLEQANDAVSTGLGEEIVAAEIRLGLTELGKVVGAIYTDDILDRVFSRFCIGK